MQSLLTVAGAILAAFTMVDALRPARGFGEVALRAIAGVSLLVLAIVAASMAAYSASILAGFVALPLLIGPALPWAFSRIAVLQTNRHGNTRPHQT